MEAACLSFATPALSALTTWLRESREPEKHLEHRVHSFNTRARCQAALQPFTHRQPTGCVWVRAASQPLPLAQEDQGVICQL